MSDVCHKTEVVPIEWQLEQRLGRVHARQRLGIETEHGHRIFGGGLNFFHPENWYSIHRLIRYCIRLSGLYWRGVNNARNIQVRHNELRLAHLPSAFEGYTLLHLTDLHVDLDPEITQALCQCVANLEYDVCVMTGDYRAQTFGECDSALAGMAALRDYLSTPVYGVLGNHDSIRMLPALESMGIVMLLNESVFLERAGERIYICGVDDPHYFRVDNLEKAAEGVPHDAVSVLLSHTPEIYRQVAHAEFDIMFCGHTHGGQICLPGGFALTLDADCPRFVGAGAWRYQQLQGYTSVGAGCSIVNTRFNCLPEVTLHRLCRA